MIVWRCVLPAWSPSEERSGTNSAPARPALDAMPMTGRELAAVAVAPSLRPE